MSVTSHVEENSKNNPSIIENLQQDFENNKKTLDIFKTMKKGDKIMKTIDCSNNTCYYTIGTADWQKTLRWWHGEDRNKTIKYLDDEFTNFTQFLDTVLFNMKNNNLLKYFSLAIDVSKFINDILPGLYSLKETYDDFDNMKAKVDSIITTLIDYKDQVELYKKQNENRRHITPTMIVRRNSK